MQHETKRTMTFSFSFLLRELSFGVGVYFGSTFTAFNVDIGPLHLNLDIDR